jgi:S-(hydroxymethyl)glutathione dehydrogenase/alcohol dehydrogenase
MVASGVCHSDLHVVDGEWARPAGVVLGHEGAAIVEELGEDVSNVRVGDLVVLAWTAPCGTCHACRRGEPWLCLTPDGAGHRLAPALVRLHRGGGGAIGAYSGVGTHSTGQVVAASAAIPVDARTPVEVAALIGCSATTGIGAVRNTAGVGAGESVVVIGLGGVGLAALMAAVHAGARPVIGVDSVPSKLELAKALGATLGVEPGGATSAVQSLVGGGADHVIEAIGRVSTAQLAVELARAGGTVTLVGMTPQGERVGIDVYRFVEDGKRLLGSNYGSADPARDFPWIAQRVVDGSLPLGRLVSARIAIEEIGAAFDAMRRGEGVRRVVVF